MDTRPLDLPQDGLKPKDLVGIPWRVAFALQDDGWWLRSDIIWAKKNCMPESVRDRPTRSHEYIFLLAKSRRYYWDQDAVKEEGVTGAWDAMPPIGGIKQTEGNDNRTYSGNRPPSDGRRNLRTVWKASPQMWRLRPDLSDDDRAYVLGQLVQRGLLASTHGNSDDWAESSCHSQDTCEAR